MEMLLFVFIFIPIVALADNVKKRKNTECEKMCRGETETLRCDSDEIITIKDVIFLEARGSRDRCNKEWTPSEKCERQISFKDLQDNCNGKQQCRVTMDYVPCTDTIRHYAKILFSCTEEHETRPVVAYPLIKPYPESHSHVWTTSKPPHIGSGDADLEKQSKEHASWRVSLGTATSALCLILLILFVVVCGVKRSSQRFKQQTPRTSSVYHDGLFIMPTIDMNSRFDNPSYSSSGQRLDRIFSTDASKFDLPTYEEATSPTAPPSYDSAFPQNQVKNNDTPQTTNTQVEAQYEEIGSVRG